MDLRTTPCTFIILYIHLILYIKKNAIKMSN